jgi:hypothetical protein
MRIERSDSNVSWDAVAALFREVGWGQRQPNEIHAAFDRSSIKTFAFEGSDLIGFGRAIDDNGGALAQRYWKISIVNWMDSWW